MTAQEKDPQAAEEVPAEPAARPRRRYNLLIVVVTVAVVGFGNMAYTNYVQHSSEDRTDNRYERLLADQARREQQIRDDRDKAAAATRAQGLRFFCEWVGKQIDPNLEPVTTPRGQQLLTANRQFYERIGCGPAPRAPKE